MPALQPAQLLPFSSVVREPTLNSMTLGPSMVPLGALCPQLLLLLSEAGLACLMTPLTVFGLCSVVVMNTASYQRPGPSMVLLGPNAALVPVLLVVSELLWLLILPPTQPSCLVATLLLNKIPHQARLGLSMVPLL